MLLCHVDRLHAVGLECGAKLGEGKPPNGRSLLPELLVQPHAVDAPQETAPVAEAQPEPAAPAAVVPESGLGAVRFSVLDDSVRAEGAQRDEVAAHVDTPEFAQDLDAHDAIDPELFEIFSEEAQELLPSLASHLRAWEESPEMT